MLLSGAPGLRKLRSVCVCCVYSYACEHTDSEELKTETKHTLAIFTEREPLSPEYEPADVSPGVCSFLTAHFPIPVLDLSPSSKVMDILNYWALDWTQP